MNKFVGVALVMALLVSFVPAAYGQCQLDPPELIDPSPGSVPFGQISLIWAPVTGATSYEPFISVDGDPPFNLGETSDTSIDVTIGPGRNVQWKVRANKAGCTSGESAVSSFTTSCPTDVPEIVAPAPAAEFAEGDTVLFAWQGVPGATSYDIYITDDFGATVEPLVENHTDNTYSAILPNGNYGWYVRANYDGQCSPGYSNPSSFLVGEQEGDPCDDHAAPVLLSPEDNATTSLPVTFEWSPAFGAVSYSVFVLIEGELRLVGSTADTSLVVDHGIEGIVVWAVMAEFPGECPTVVSEPRVLTIQGEDTCATGEAVPLSPPNGATNLTSPVTFRWRGVEGAVGYRVLAAINSNEAVPLGITDDTELTAEVPAGGGFWVVQTFFGENCPATISERSAITISSGAACDDDGPVLVSPANNATNVGSVVTFNWNPVPNATRYALFVATSGDDFDFYGGTEETELEAFVPAGVTRWFVAAIFPGCPEARSATFTFTAGQQNNCPDGAIVLQSPAQNATVPSPVTLSWSALAGVQSYRLTILVNGESAVTRRTTNTSETVELPAGEHRWQVEGIRQGCEPVVSDEGRFSVQRAANCDANQRPTLVSPVGTQGDPTIVTSPVTFAWNASNGAIGYRLWVSRNGNPFEDIGVTSQTQATIPLPPGVYAWYLEAGFRGCDPVASTVAYFAIRETVARCPGAAPVPLSPAQGSTAAAPVQFSWTAVRENARYRLFASVDGSEERLIGVTEDTHLSRILPPGSVSWRVEVVADDCAALSSGPITFTVPQAANCGDEKPELLGPAGGATLTEQEVSFAWTPVSGAVRYVVIAQTGDGSRVAVGDTTETSLTRKMPFGEITWSVMAFFAGCDPRESSPSTFTIAPPQNCPNRGPILLLPSETNRDVFSPVTFAWTRVPGATIYQIWVPQGSPVMGVVAETTENLVEVELPPGRYQAYVIAKFANCPSTESAVIEFTVNEPIPCGTPGETEAQVVGQALSGTPYRLRWSPLPNVQSYEVQQSTTPDFANAETFIANAPSLRFLHENSGPPMQYFYRVRGISNCDDSRGPYSEPVGVFIIAPRTNNSSAEMGVEGTIVQTVVLPPQNPPLQFVARVDKPWLTVTPPSGTVGAEPVTLTVTADPAFLGLGTNTGTVRVEYTSPAGGKVTTHATTTVTVPISVSLVTPVTPSGKGTPPPDALIFPIVGHAAGVNDSLFESDIRIANLTPQTMKYLVTFTPSGVDGTQTGSSTTIDVAPNTTIALDDIVASVFGTGTTSSAIGMLEVRPLTTTTTNSSSGLFSSLASTFPSLPTAASSRTYNFTPNGTFGQFIPAIPFAKFVGKGAILSLQQVAQSAAYRANFGFAEAGGSPVSLQMRVYDTKSSLLATIPINLGPMQHLQMNGLLAQNGITDLADGRVEVEVLDGNGKVTAYVSEIDNKTNDPLLVNAVPKGATLANRYVVPGMAYINNGFAFWVSDLRVFNAGTASTPATLTFYPQGNGTPVSRDIVLDAGEIEVLDNVVANLFGLPNGSGGAIAITTPTNTRLSATARTYNQTSNGTYGQFIPGVTVAESVGAADRALQLLQLETSSRMRTNIGVSETSGNPVTIEITAIQPDSIVTPVVTLNLAPNEFRQLSLAEFFEAGAAVYNARVTVKVIGGNGRVTAYGSAIDVITQDPTYVPAM